VVRSLLSVSESSVNRPTKHMFRSLLSVSESSVNRPTEHAASGAQGHFGGGKNQHESHH
jgi:hypothetical protein